MSHSLISAACLFLAASASAARIEGAPVGSDRVQSPAGLSAELVLSPDGGSALARLSRCRENVYDWPQQCSDEVTFALPGLAVDAEKRTITHDGNVVARWSRFGRFIRLEPSYKLVHEVSAPAEEAAGNERRMTRRAKLHIARVEGE